MHLRLDLLPLQNNTGPFEVYDLPGKTRFLNISDGS